MALDGTGRFGELPWDLFSRPGSRRCSSRQPSATR